MYPFTTSTPRLVTRSPSPTTIEYTVTTAPIPPKNLWTRYLLLAWSVVVKALVVGVWIFWGGVKYRDEVVMRGGSLEELWWGFGGVGRWVESTSEDGELGMVGWLVGCARVMEWWWIGAGLVMGGGWAGRRGYTEESLLIMRNLGIQTRTCPSSTFSPLFLLSPLPTLLSPLASFFLTPLLTLLSSLFQKLFPNTPLPGQSSNWSFTSFLGHGGTTRFIPTSQIQDVWIHEGFVGFEVRFFLGVVVKGEEEIVVVFPRTLPGKRVCEAVWRGLRGCLYEKGVRDGVRGIGEGK
ncbi:hypothetical protein L211DRAFT_509877 [Terfezia boudieri ATCC MYA-4762]|uniref:Phosphatidylinositol N-acetylglucosaminyltransferase subunit H conserved domain-containing protein n=1 Tax=Terfezia boudieri ATCC MYA-4762 TaxID=1051890 RepID=A0A3N4LCK5_9PEZI|nr:hypothetical protein L211DRAFT_509877 [Terfezia boudieri ATCC MYA-4762]